ncbi:MAG: sulfite exporter TauE/SafE family protein [Pseudolabrys sp.]|nr:sulfite exporter TauE/SafE family protein [Pseudolabrys sp.]
MDFAAGFADISLWQLVVVAVVAFCANVLGGVAGYGTGALMPLVLVPIIGAAPVVPIIAISALFTNFSRAAAFHRYLDWPRVRLALIAAIPTCVLGAWGYTFLTGKGAAIAIGAMLVLSVPLRWMARKRGFRFGDAGFAAGSTLYGLLVGGTAGSGVIMLTLLLSAGLEGAAVVATDAVISIVISVIKISVFGYAGVLTPQVIAFALLIGLSAMPGAFVARILVERMPVHVHTAILDAVVLVGGLSLIAGALR